MNEKILILICNLRNKTPVVHINKVLLNKTIKRINYYLKIIVKE